MALNVSRTTALPQRWESGSDRCAALLGDRRPVADATSLIKISKVTRGDCVGGRVVSATT